MLQIVLNHHEFVVTSEGEDFAGAVLMAAIDASALSTATFLLEEGYVAATHQNDRGETAMHRVILKHDAVMTHLLRRFDVKRSSVFLDGRINYARSVTIQGIESLLDLPEDCGTSTSNGATKVTIEKRWFSTTWYCCSVQIRLTALLSKRMVAFRGEKTQLLMDAGEGYSPTLPPLKVAQRSQYFHHGVPSLT